jgi:hypothetical protein
MSATLIGNRVSESEVFNVPSVPFTKTFKPFHHRQVIESIRSALNMVGLNIVSSEYALANSGNRMFGVFDLDSGTDELGWSMGFRNALDKSFAITIIAGSRVFLCSNLAFDGEAIEMRRHTKGLTLDELEFLAFRAIKTLVRRLTSFQDWHLGLKQYELSETDAKVLLVDMISNNIFPASKLPRFHDLYFGGAYDNTLYGCHESATEVLKDTNLLTLPKKNKALNTVLNHYIESIDADLPSPLGDFYERRAKCLCL